MSPLIFYKREVFTPILAGVLLSVTVLWGQTIRFKEVAKELGVPGNTVSGVSAYGHGVIMADINNDGLPDIYISNAVRYADRLSETLYLSSPNGYFENDKARGVDDPYGWTGSHGICFVDYDNDGDYDIYNATTDDRNRLYQNKGNAYFKDVTDAAKLPLIRKVFPDFDSEPYGYGTRGVLAFDANNDGYMDLLAVNWGPAEKRYSEQSIILIPPQPNEFYLNNGNGTFKTVDNSGLTQPPNHSFMGTQGVVAGDIDGDGDIDVFIVHRNYTGVSDGGQVLAGFDPGRQIPNQLMINDGLGNFSDETAILGLFDAVNDANGATLADYDTDGDLDIFVAPKNKNREFVRVYRNRGNGFFDDVTAQLELRQWGFSTFFLDADNDGDLDIIAPRTHESTIFYRNRGDGTFEQVTDTGIEIYNYDPRGGAVADIDDDGDLDIYFADANKDIKAEAGNRLYRNELKSSNRWLKITGRGPKGDRGGFGTKIWVFERGQMDNIKRLVGYRDVQNAYGYLCQDDPVQHFGLGQRDSVDVKVKLLDGTTLRMFGAPAKTKLFFSKPAAIVESGGDHQSAPALSNLPQPLQVRVRDAYGNTVYGARVIFSSDDPSAHFSPTEVYSNREGYAQVWYTLGGNSSQTVTAFLEASPSSKVTFSAAATPTTVTNLIKISGDDQKGQAGYPLPSPVVVRALTAAGSAVANETIVFQTSGGSGQVNGAEFAETQTDAGGYAQAQWTLGPAPSSTQNLTASVKSMPAVHQQFGATTFGSPAKLVWLSAYQFTGPVHGELPDTLKARITDDSDNLLRDVPVSFEVTAGNGSINGSSRVTQLTDLKGEVKVKWTLGTQAGTDNQKLRIDAGSLQNSPTVVKATALAGPATRLVKISGDGQTGYRAQTLPAPLVVAVTDTFDNAIQGHDVLYTLTVGDGTFSGKREALIQTDPSGRASVFLTLGAEPEYTVRAIAKHNDRALEGSPVVFKLRGITGDPAAETSEFLAPATLVADGETRGELSVTLRDAYGNPISGRTVVLKTTGVAVNLSPPQPTDDQGRTAAFFTTTNLGQVVIELIVNDHALLSRSVACIAGPPAAMRAFGNRQMQRTGQVLPQPIAVNVVDRVGHPVSELPVTFTVVDGGGSILEPQPVLTNSAGIAAAYWRLGSTYGEQNAQAVIEGFEPIRFTAEAIPHDSVMFSIVSGDMQTAAPEQVLADSFVVQLTDSLDRPIPNVEVTFIVNEGAGTSYGYFISPNNPKTDVRGRAAALFFTGSETGIRTITASCRWGTVQFSVLVRRGRNLTFIKRSADGMITLPHAEIKVVVQVLDDFGRPASGEPILCTLTGGGALLDPPPYFASAEGIFTVNWRVGAAGLQTCEIKSLNGTGSAVFTATVANRAPVFVSPSPLPKFVNLIVGSEAILAFQASDPDHDKVTLLVHGMPDGMIFQLGDQAVLRWMPRADQLGDAVVTIIAQDSHGAEDSVRVVMQVSREYAYFPLTRRLPESQNVELPYDRQAVFLLETADVVPPIDWYIETDKCASGPLFLWTFSKDLYPEPEVSVTAYLHKDERLQIVSWQVRLVSGRGVEFEDANASLPKKTELSQNYPNPFNPTTTLRYALASTASVRLAVFSLDGRLIRTLIEGKVPAGEHQTVWDGRDEEGNVVPSGVYYYRLQAGEVTETRKLTLLK